MEHSKLRLYLPSEIDVASRDASDSCVLSGPADDIRKFSKKLINDGVSVAEIFSFNLPLHSRYAAKAAPKLLEYLKKVC